MRRIVRMELLTGALTSRWDGFYATTSGATVTFTPLDNTAQISALPLPQNQPVYLASKAVAAYAGTVYVFRVEPADY